MEGESKSEGLISKFVIAAIVVLVIIIIISMWQKSCDCTPAPAERLSINKGGWGDGRIVNAVQKRTDTGFDAYGNPHQQGDYGHMNRTSYGVTSSNDSGWNVDWVNLVDAQTNRTVPPVPVGDRYANVLKEHYTSPNDTETLRKAALLSSSPDTPKDFPDEKAKNRALRRATLAKATRLDRYRDAVMSGSQYGRAWRVEPGNPLPQENSMWKYPGEGVKPPLDPYTTVYQDIVSTGEGAVAPLPEWAAQAAQAEIAAKAEVRGGSPAGAAKEGNLERLTSGEAVSTILGRPPAGSPGQSPYAWIAPQMPRLAPGSEHLTVKQQCPREQPTGWNQFQNLLNTVEYGGYTYQDYLNLGDAYNTAYDFEHLGSLSAANGDQVGNHSHMMKSFGLNTTGLDQQLPGQPAFENTYSFPDEPGVEYMRCGPNVGQSLPAERMSGEAPYYTEMWSAYANDVLSGKIKTGWDDSMRYYSRYPAPDSIPMSCGY